LKRPSIPHILILDGGKIAFLDFGAVGRLREELKLDALEAVYASTSRRQCQNSSACWNWPRRKSAVALRDSRKHQ
jgi:predicted unusual protein kinase regulating ubiquinone biosynthesis (AarF/ABC1/UbiB family)